MPLTLLTDVAEALLTTAAGSGSQVAIAEIALGDGLGANYNPSHSQTALKRERARQPILSRVQTDPNTWRVKAEFDTDTPAFEVREMGFFDAAGNLIAIWAGADVVPRQTGAIVYLVEHYLHLSRIDGGLITIAAPDDRLIGFQAQVIRGLADLRLEQFHQAEALRAAGHI
ncbi:MAG: phage tail protein [Rhodobacter sp.]|nr:phage tail protein [Rhodobacter sp.]